MFSYPKLVGQTVTRVIQAGLEGSAVVFVHGTGARADRWIRNLEPVAEAGFRAYAIDLPGHGLAAKDPAFNHSVPAYAEFLGQFLNNFGGEKVTLIGTSLGGHVAATCTINRPEGIERLMLVGSMGLVPVGVETRLRIQGGATNQTGEQFDGRGRLVSETRPLYRLRPGFRCRGRPAKFAAIRHPDSTRMGHRGQDSSARRRRRRPSPHQALQAGPDRGRCAHLLFREAGRVQPTPDGLCQRFPRIHGCFRT